jgi:uncharacterized protein (DUF1330 family)
MEVRVKVGLALLAGVAVGLAAGQTLHAQQKPHGYLVAVIDEISDAAKFAEAGKKTGPLFEAHKAKYIVRGETIAQVTGPAPKRALVAEFPSLDAAKAWAADPKTKAVQAELDQVSKQRRFLIEGMQ